MAGRVDEVEIEAREIEGHERRRVRPHFEERIAKLGLAHQPGSVASSLAGQ